jgi:branched-subunit amino acid transport protein AzlD
MRGLAAILEEEVAGGARERVVLGRDTGVAERPQPRVDVERLNARLDAQARFNNGLIVTIVVSYLMLLALIAVLVVLHHDDVQWLAAGLGANLLTLAGSVGFLRDLWREKSYIDMLLAILPSLTAAEAMKTLRAFYFEKVAPKRGPRTTDSATAG